MWEHACYHALVRQHFFHPLRPESAHGSPYMCGSKCGVQDRAAELRNVPRANLATGLAQEVPIYSPGKLNTQ